MSGLLTLKRKKIKTMSNEEMNEQIQAFQDSMTATPDDDGMTGDQLKVFQEEMAAGVVKTIQELKGLEDKGLEVLMEIIERKSSTDSNKINAVAVLFANVQMKRDAISDLGMGRG